ncbi:MULTISPECIES: NAD(P)-dependent alcohol dehydrogenase [unclassified Micromonospora]|uniref:NAD(P)-dependent alcohol dehydrogenase n=1 Tax=unclassified Micromonospora TaxID=2617518 RepID=UPI001C23DED0|nr:MULTISPECIES: NAD(P)-dependent alcohol dehydrogenase [unclassified Micromonospora]MBU8861800.1 NAD(P)-dependent alcohol dehydrogenase [Micromonospora sp. WMMB482]MDM4781381.1 NAD(P)-dependent alcohol dehydrogenase [Micromonospora sp. b486]
MASNIGWATAGAAEPLASVPFDRGPVGPEDVRIAIAFCGVCHSDIHQARDEFGGGLTTNFPCLPGHEIAGTVSEVGERVQRHAVGDRVGVGCMVYWGSEDQRGAVDEQYQVPPPVYTYNTRDPDSGQVTFGGYSDEIVVNEHFVLRIPDSLSLERAAPMLCAGVTTWSPLKHWNVGDGQVVAIAGVGGLGHMAIQLAKARGAAKVIALTTTAAKRDDAVRLGADEVIVMPDSDAVTARQASVDFLLSTIPTPFDMKPYLSLVKHDGAFVTVGMLEPSLPQAIDFGIVSMLRVSVAGSLIGSIAETQEVLDFCAEHRIAADVEVITADRVNEAFDNVVAKKARFRYVIDNSTIRSAAT